MNFLLFAFAAYGLCFGLMNDKIPFFHQLKKIPLFPDLEGKTFFERMFECPYCTGFHTGWVVWLSLALPNHISANTDSVTCLAEILSWAFASSAFCYALDALILLVEKKTPG